MTSFLIDKRLVIIYRLDGGGGWGDFWLNIVTFSWSPLKYYFIEVILPYIKLDKLRDSPLPHFFAHTFTFWRIYLVLLTVIWKWLFQFNNDFLMVEWSRHGTVSWSVWSQYLIRVLSRNFHRCPIKRNKRRKLKRGPKGQANLGGSGGMTPRKILNI